MFYQLKRLVLFLYLLLWRKKNRDKTVRSLTSNTKRHRYIVDIPEITTVLDEITNTPNEYADTIRFTGFDRDGSCANIELQRYQSAKSLRMDLEIPGLGHFSYTNSARNEKSEDNQSKNIGCEKLCIYNHQPMRRWKLYFRGFLNHINQDGKRLHARILLYWQCLSDPYDYFASLSCWELANNLLHLPLREIYHMCYHDFIWYQQWGELRGNVEIEGCEKVTLRLKCIRERIYQPFPPKGMQIHSSRYIVLEDSGFALVSNSVGINNTGPFHLGFITFPIGDSHSSKVVLQQSERADRNSRDQRLSEIIEACNNTYEITENAERTLFNPSDSGVKYKTFTVNDSLAYGLETLCANSIVASLTDGENKNGPCKEVINAKLDKEILIAGLDEEMCGNRNLVGGKACQLSILRSMKTLNVPKGFCLTTNALTKHIAENAKLSGIVESIPKYLRERTFHKLKEVCEKAVTEFLKLPLNENIQGKIKQHLNGLYGGNEWNHRKFAVRSSSISEDSVDSSSAGQMDTFLSVQGFHNLVDAVQRCWASSLSFQVVEYRRQSGQPLIESMGVVIQEMVDADVSGVLFTNDPVSGDENKMMINASFGPEDLVVSGRVNPDTVIVKRDNDDMLDVETTIAGEKGSEVDIYNDSVIAEKTANRSKNELCLTKEEILLICNNGLQIEKKFSCGQDIEWALTEDTLFILQTRPITSLDMETDEEILHEFDSPVVNDNMLITPANIQEMMPGAVSTLTSDLFARACDRALKFAVSGFLGLTRPVHAATTAFLFSGLPLLSMTPLTASMINNYIGGEKSKSDFEMYIFGQSVKEHTIDTIKKHYGRKSSHWLKAKKMFSTFVLRNRKGLSLFDKTQEKSDTFQIGENARTAMELYESIDGKLIEYYEMWRVYLIKSGESSTWTSLIMAILKVKSNEMSVENLADVALILSECKDVYSADVPVAVSSLAREIGMSNVKEGFLNTPDDLGDEFLKNVKDPHIKASYSRFMVRHGHRCIREAELLEKSWARDPSTLMNALKMIIKNNVEAPKHRDKSVDEIVDGLKTPLSWMKRMLLKYFLIEKAMNGVRCRELGKSVAIKFCNIFKEAYWRLAELMVRESRLPDPKLLFFLTHAEIGELIEQRSTKLLKLAKRRMEVFPEMMETRFPKINIGLPKPLKKLMKSNFQLSSRFTECQFLEEKQTEEHALSNHCKTQVRLWKAMF